MKILQESTTMRYAVTSDVHLGHRKTPTEHIITSFIKTILTEENKELDVLFIAGDLLDRVLDFNSIDVHKILEFFHILLNYCYSNDIALRVLEGTPRHDSKQSQNLFNLNEVREFKCDLKYFKTLDIEFLERLGKYVLYIPDEWSSDHQEVERQIQEKLHEHNITKVDIAILHGQFKYQFAGVPYFGFYYQEEYFLNLVKGFIHIGHYHTYNPLGRILPNGSLERLVHGEEEAKGYVRVTDTTYEFIENKNAYIYKTIKINSTTTVDKLDKLIAKYPKESYIRLRMNKEHPFNITFGELKLRYLDYRLKKQLTTPELENKKTTHILSDTNIDFSNKFTLEANLHKLLLESITTKHQLDSIENKKLLDYISIFKMENITPALSQI